MTLVDTSVWVEHFRKGDLKLQDLLADSKAVVHPFIIGELACGNLKNRAEILHLLSELPQSIVAEQGEVLKLVDSKRLFGTGLGWIDAHLLASALLSNVTLISYDKAVREAASRLGIKYR